ERQVVADWKEHGLIFPSEVGTPLAPRNLERYWYAARARAGLSDQINFHLLRRTVASRLTEIGTPDVVIGPILAHSKKNVTQGYITVSIAAMRAALEQIEALLLAHDDGTNNSQIDS